MYYVDSHIHMVSRITDDYVRMARADVWPIGASAETALNRIVGGNHRPAIYQTAFANAVCKRFE